LQGDELVIAKIIVGGETTEEINTFKYLGYEISYRNNGDVEEKLKRFCSLVVL
jgi:hypothetical protein